MLIMVAAIAGGGCAPAFNWRDVRSIEHGFSVLLPARVASMTRTIDLDGQSVDMTLTGARAEQCLFSVGSARLASDESSARAHALASMQTAMLRNIGAQGLPAVRVITLERTDAAGAPAGRIEAVRVEAMGRLAGEPVVLQAVFVGRGARIWQAVAITPPALVEQGQTMLDAFRIID